MSAARASSDQVRLRMIVRIERQHRAAVEARPASFLANSLLPDPDSPATPITQLCANAHCDTLYSKDVKLSYRDRLRMAWELTWPMALIDLTVVILLHGFLEVQGESADSIWAVIGFFGVSPWVVRRALNLKYGTCDILPKLSYQQSLKVMWLLGWRTLALSLAALVPVSLVLRALHLDANLGRRKSADRIM